MTTPWPGTDALILLVVVEVAPVHRLVRVAAPVLPIAAVVVEIVAVVRLSLNSTTETSPLASGLASTSCPLVEATSRPCLPNGSWSTAITRALVSVLNVVALALGMLVPAMSGAAISAHRLNSARSSVADMPLPISSMSGSFHAPGPAKLASPTLAWKMLSMLVKFGAMSPVVRQLLPTPEPQVHTVSCPQLHRLNRIGRPVAARASRMVVYRDWALTPWLLQLSYLR